MNLIMLCGAGGVGKSTVTAELAKIPKVYTMRSSTRDTYARLGIPTETAAFGMSVETQVFLQDEILKDHLAKIERSINEAKAHGFDYLVIDRSPLDHLAYWTRTNVLTETSSNEDFTAQLLKVMVVMVNPEVNVVGWFDFPYPVQWPTADGQRDQNQIRTFEMSLMTTGMVQRYHQVAKQLRSFYATVDAYTVEDRVEFIMRKMVDA